MPGGFDHLLMTPTEGLQKQRFGPTEPPFYDAQKYEFSGHCAWVNKIVWPMCFSQGIAFFPLSRPSWRQPGDRCKDLSFVYVFLQMISQWPPVFLRSSDTVAGSWFVIRLGFTIMRPGNISSWTWKSLKIARHVVPKCELFWWYNAGTPPCCLLLRVASPNDLNLGTLVTSEPRLNPGFTSWGDFVGSTVGRVQWSTVIHSDPGCDPLGSDPANGYTTYITQVLSDTLLFLLAPKNTTFFFFAGAFPLQPSFHVCWVTAAFFQCRTSLLYNKFFSKGASKPPTPDTQPCPVPCRCRCCGEAVFLRSPNCGNIQAEAREMSSKLSQDP